MMLIVRPLMLVIAACFVTPALSETSRQRITLSYVFKAADGLGRLRAASGIPTAHDPNSIRVEIAKLAGVPADTLRLIATGFGVDREPSVAEDSHRDVQYRVSYCRYDAMGVPHVEFDKTLPSKGTTILISREKGADKFVIALTDFLAPMDVDIVAIQEQQERELEAAGGRVEWPGIAPAYPCPSEPE